MTRRKSRAEIPHHLIYASLIYGKYFHKCIRTSFPFLIRVQPHTVGLLASLGLSCLEKLRNMRPEVVSYWGEHNSVHVQYSVLCLSSLHMGGRGKRTLSSLRATLWVPDQPGLQCETLPQKDKAKLT